MSKPWIHEDCLELVANLADMNCSASISDGILTLEDGTQIDLIGCCGKERESDVKELLKEIAGLAQDDSDDICELGWSLSEILEKATIAIKEIEDE